MYRTPRSPRQARLAVHAAAVLTVLLASGTAACGSATDPAAGAPPAPGTGPTGVTDGASAEATSEDVAEPTADPSAPATDASTDPAADQSTPAPTQDAAGADPLVTIDDFAYQVPATVAPGATVQVSNVDVETHTLTSREDGAFAVTVPVDGTLTFVAPTAPGTYEFVCLLHGGMEGVLTVG